MRPRTPSFNTPSWREILFYQPTSTRKLQARGQERGDKARETLEERAKFNPYPDGLRLKHNYGVLGLLIFRDDMVIAIGEAVVKTRRTPLGRPDQAYFPTPRLVPDR